MHKPARHYAYLISRQSNDGFNRKIQIADYYFQYNSNSNAIFKRCGDREIIVFGKVVSSSDCMQSESDIADELLQSISLDDLLFRMRTLAGRFVTVYFSGKELYVIPDAAASIHVTYTLKEYDLFVSSNAKIIADHLGWEESAESKSIKSCASPSHSLPYDLSMFDQIKHVIPNHYLNCGERKIVRFYPSRCEDSIGIDQAVRESVRIIGNIITAYHHKYELALPLTSGVDSRSILSFLREKTSDIHAYTYYHPHFTPKTPDIVIPGELCNKHGIEYSLLPDLKLPTDVSDMYEKEFGACANKLEATNAWTYCNSNLANRVRVDGNISPLAKSSFGRNLPERFASPSYLATKTHNHSKTNKQFVMKWVSDAKPFIERSNISRFDLFFWEHRIGKWTANSYLNSDFLIDSINPYNCRALLELWLNVPRNQRTTSSIQLELIKMNWPELMEFPFNPNDRLSVFYKNQLLYYFAVRFKHLLKL